MHRLAPLTAFLLALAACKGSEEPSCPAGQTDCGGVCRDLQTSPAACGVCGRVCPIGAACVSGTCHCPGAEAVCLSACVDLQADPLHCGSCDHACTLAPPWPALGTCSGGACACQNGATSCPALEPECRDLQGDAGACGACDIACTRGGSVCDAGTCACPPSLPDACSPPDVPAAICANLDSDPAHCGTCANACPLAGEACGGGACACPASAPTPCPAGAPTACVNTLTDASSCGSCGHACATGASCSGGACACPSGEVPCSGACVDTQASTANCGACGNTCASGQACTTGVCCAPDGVVCAPSAGPKVCCAGNACCPGGACETVHANGLGGTFLDCNPLGTYTEASAGEAARSWSATGTSYGGYTLGCGTIACLGWQTATACGIWCWGVSDADALRGRVNVNTASQTCVCPLAGSPQWN